MPFPWVDSGHFPGDPSSQGTLSEFATVANIVSVANTNLDTTTYPAVQTTSGNGAVARTWQANARQANPSTATRDAGTYITGGAGWAYPLATIAPPDSRGQTIVRAQNVTIGWSALAVVSATGGSNTLVPKVALWKWNPSTQASTLLATNTGASATISTVLSNNQSGGLAVTLAVPLTVLARTETLYFQVGATITTGAGLLGAAVTGTYLFQSGSGTSITYQTQGPRRAYTESATRTGRGLPSLPARRLAATHITTGRGSGTSIRRARLQRAHPANGSGASALTKKAIKKHITATGRGGATISKRLLIVTYSVTGRGRAASAKRVLKTMPTRVGRGSATATRKLSGFKAMTSTGRGVATYSRSVTKQVRFNATGRATIRPRIALDWDDLPDTGQTTVIKRPVFVMDD